MQEATKMKTLIAWFSWSGTTEKIAEDLQKKTGADMFRIERKIPYSTDYKTCAYGEAAEEHKNNSRPAIKGPLSNIENYDAVILAFPIWWYTAPTPVFTFLESFPVWKGKKIYIVADAYSDNTKQYENSVRDSRISAQGAEVVPGMYNEEIRKADAWLKKENLIV